CDCGQTSFSCVMDSVKKGKICDCHPGYFEVNGYCTGCSCGDNSYGCYSTMYTSRMCLCHRGYTSFNGYCRECFCGDHSYACIIDWLKGKVCHCHPGYVEMDGYCMDPNSTEKPMTKSYTSTPRALISTETLITKRNLHQLLKNVIVEKIRTQCLCGEHSYSCAIDPIKGKMCLCVPGYVYIPGSYCTASSTTTLPSTTRLTSTSQGSTEYRNTNTPVPTAQGSTEYRYTNTPVPTSRGSTEYRYTNTPCPLHEVCYCGVNSYSCVFHWRYGKLCHCHPGYVQINDYCSESSSTEYPVPLATGPLHEIATVV
ncbi:hypothetical protein CEXT_658091, partial [Caerostris extrusa]